MATDQNTMVAVSSRLELMQQNLAEQVRIYQHLLEIAEQKQRVLMENNLSELERLVKTEELLVMEAGKLETQRGQLQLKIARELGVESQALTLTRLRESLGEPAEALQQTGEQLFKVVTALNQLNQQNLSLIEHSLQYLDFTVHLLTQVGNNSSVYGQKGAEVLSPGQERARIFDKKA